MTEYKRFKLDNFDSTREILELLDTQRLVISDMEKENEELKKENEKLKKENDAQKDTINAIRVNIETVDKENTEDLKTTIELIETILQTRGAL